MRTLFIVSRELEYPRNDVLLRAFRRLGQVTVLGEHGRGSILSRSLRLGLKAIPHLLQTDLYDSVFVGFYGHILMLLIGRLSRRPVLFDAFLSTYDTLCFDRRLFSPESPAGRLAFWLDRTACRAADLTLLDTRLHAKYFIETFSLPAERVAHIPVGCNEAIFFPHPVDRSSRGDTVVLYYSTYLPLHGADIVVEAAALLRDTGIRFRLIGEGMQLEMVRSLSHKYGLENIQFVPFLPLEDLASEIGKADICLGGHFGHSEKAGRVIPAKIYQMLAMAKPIIAAASPANREVLTHGVNAYLCPPGDPQALADAILGLHKQPESRIQLGSRGRALYQDRFSETVLTDLLKRLGESLSNLE